MLCKGTCGYGQLSRASGGRTAAPFGPRGICAEVSGTTDAAYASCTLNRVADMKKANEVQTAMRLSCAMNLMAPYSSWLIVAPTAPAKRVMPAASARGFTCV